MIKDVQCIRPAVITTEQLIIIGFVWRAACLLSFIYYSARLSPFRASLVCYINRLIKNVTVKTVKYYIILDFF